jgi:peroxiredoxin
MRQLVQLAEYQAAFAEQGVNVAAITYDSREVLAGFHAEQNLSYPLLQDVEAKHFSAYGVVNEDYEPGGSMYGIPYPGVLYIGADGTVLLKFAVPGYRQRPPFKEVLAAIEGLQEGG